MKVGASFRTSISRYFGTSVSSSLHSPFLLLIDTRRFVAYLLSLHCARVHQFHHSLVLHRDSGHSFYVRQDHDDFLGFISTLLESGFLEVRLQPFEPSSFKLFYFLNFFCVLLVVVLYLLNIIILGRYCICVFHLRDLDL